MFKNIIRLLTNMKTIHLVMLPVAISLLPIFMFILLGSAGYRNTPIQFILLSLTFFLWGLMGLPMVIRKELPWLITIRGWMAVIEGFILLLIGSGLAIGFMVLMLSTK